MGIIQRQKQARFISFRPIREHTQTQRILTHKPRKKALILQRRWALSTAQNTHTQIRKLELFLTISSSLCFNLPHLYLRELAPCVLSFRLCKVNKTLFTSKTKFLNFLIHNPALDIEVCQAGFCSYDNRAAIILWYSLCSLWLSWCGSRVYCTGSRLLHFSTDPSELFHNYGGWLLKIYTRVCTHL